ncbi:MAG: phytanoyl-CoA dioxygenase family protein [Chitinophagales bacterium]|nr:phytanoyl-CoA dioxygenase family protein [Chitinophagales bacterium]MDW8273706.1 phytanoyl-CoA dioxygenase family protein [Chitinophagales bacterium]
MPAPPIFKNPEHQKIFDKQGFVVTPLLNRDEVEYMDRLFDELHKNLSDSGFHSGSYSSDMAYKRKVSEEIKRVFRRAYEETFQNYTPFGGAYLYKIPSPNSDLFLHQDWTIVDESRYVAVNVWTPLCDITEDNGPLMVLPGSHYDNFPVLRAPTMRYFFDHDYEVVLRQLIPMIVPAGTAVILNQSLVHYSPPNTSDKIRKAITAGVKTKDAQMIFHFKDPNRKDNLIEKFEMDDEFLIHFENFFEDIYKRPKVGKSLGFIEYEVPMLTGAALEDLVRKMKTSAGYKYIEQTAPTYQSKAQNTSQHETINTSTPRQNLFKTYSPANILREIKYRLTGR